VAWLPSTAFAPVYWPLLLEVVTGLPCARLPPVGGGELGGGELGGGEDGGDEGLPVGGDVVLPHCGAGQTPVQTGGSAYQPVFVPVRVTWKPEPTQLCIGLGWAMPLARTLLKLTWLGACTCKAYVPAPTMFTSDSLMPVVWPSIQCSAAYELS
jgi:hypothetical protein